MKEYKLELCGVKRVLPFIPIDGKRDCTGV